ncbi:MAG TPA: hypothetical protein P5572_05840 [Phycisphaerae bacterium]|nr:hypothetical protein [Phycisphaerae bacterium]
MTAPDNGNRPSDVSGAPPVDLPRVPRLFWSARPEFHDLAVPEPPVEAAVLERLGPPPFAKSRFPFIGFLATIYDHVATHAGGRT